MTHSQSREGIIWVRFDTKTTNYFERETVYEIQLNYVYLSFLALGKRKKNMEKNIKLSCLMIFPLRGGCLLSPTNAHILYLYSARLMRSNYTRFTNPCRVSKHQNSLDCLMNVGVPTYRHVPYVL